MAQIPYYGLSQGNIGGVNIGGIEDQYAGLRSGLGKLQEFVEQKERVESGKLLAKARSDWNIRLNELQKEKGLDAEGFSALVEQEMMDYESNILSSVPYSQRESFSAQFSGIKYDILTKSSLYESDALSKKMVQGVEETMDYNANSILSDFTQRQNIIDDTDDMIDDLDIADSVKEQLKKDARNKYAISEIKALTDLDAKGLLSKLNSGYYDADIDPKQKMAAISGAKYQIEKNERDVKIKAAEEFDAAHTRNLMAIYSNEVNDIDFAELANSPMYHNRPKELIEIKRAWDSYKDDELNYLQTTIDLENGIMMNPSNADKKRIDEAFFRSSKDNPSFSDINNTAVKFVEKSNYIPKNYSGIILNMSNSSVNDKRKTAYEAWYELNSKYPNLTSNVNGYRSDELMAYGSGLKSGYSLSELDKMLKGTPSSYEIDNRGKKLKDIMEDGVDFDVDFDIDDNNISSIANKIFSSWYMETGSEDIAKDVAEKFINNNYGDTFVGVGNPGEWVEESEKPISSTFKEPISSSVRLTRGIFSTKSKVMYQPPEKAYAINGLSKRDLINYLNEDLLFRVQDSYPDMKQEDIRIDNVLMYTSEGKPKYLVTNKKGVPLYDGEGYMYWSPDYKSYLSRKREEYNKKAPDFIKTLYGENNG